MDKSGMHEATAPGGGTLERETGGALTRRQLLHTAAGAGLALLLPMLSERAQAAPAQWGSVGKAQTFVKGQPQKVTVAGGAVLYVTRVGETTLSAVSAKCTHRGCEVGWNPGDKNFHCPCHGAVFASDGKNVHGTRRQPDESLPPLLSIPARQKDGQVEVNLAGLPPTDAAPVQG